jgi:proteasome lid subunit RPN8/RPN11
MTRRRQKKSVTVTSPDISEVSTVGLAKCTWPGPKTERTKGFQVVVRQSVLNDMHGHAHSSLAAEICGVMVGDIVRDNRGPFVSVEASIRGEFATSEITGVTFTAETWAHIQAILDAKYPGKKIVGWYHSHPNFGVFLSKMDLFIQDNFFNLPWQIAYVVDPIRSEDAIFVWSSGKPTKETFIVDKDVEMVEYHAPVKPPHKDKKYSSDETVKGEELLDIRSRLKWLTAGVMVGLIISTVWPVVLIYIALGSRATPPHNTPIYTTPPASTIEEKEHTTDEDINEPRVGNNRPGHPIQDGGEPVKALETPSNEDKPNDK